jgi:hypothetical protein
MVETPIEVLVNENSFKAAHCCNQQEQISIYSLSGTIT